MGGANDDLRGRFRPGCLGSRGADGLGIVSVCVPALLWWPWLHRRMIKLEQSETPVGAHLRHLWRSDR